MARYHISKSGNPGTCKAQEGHCPLSPINEHYLTKEKAYEAFEVKANKSIELFKRAKDNTNRKFASRYFYGEGAQFLKKPSNFTQREFHDDFVKASIKDSRSMRSIRQLYEDDLLMSRGLPSYEEVTVFDTSGNLLLLGTKVEYISKELTDGVYEGFYVNSKTNETTEVSVVIFEGETTAQEVYEKFKPRVLNNYNIIYSDRNIPTSKSISDVINTRIIEKRDFTRSQISYYKEEKAYSSEADKRRLQALKFQEEIWFAMEIKSKEKNLSISEAADEILYEYSDYFNEKVGLASLDALWFTQERTEEELMGYAFSKILKECNFKIKE